MVSLLEAMDPWFLYIHGGFSIYIMHLCSFTGESCIEKALFVPIFRVQLPTATKQINKHATSWFYITGY